MDIEEIVTRIALLEEELVRIRERNQRVEKDKAWETSWFRVVSVVVLTYALMCMTFWLIKVEHPFINAIVPTLGYFLSTQSLPVLKSYWLERRER